MACSDAPAAPPATRWRSSTWHLSTLESWPEATRHNIRWEDGFCRNSLVYTSLLLTTIPPMLCIINIPKSVIVALNFIINIKILFFGCCFLFSRVAISGRKLMKQLIRDESRWIRTYNICTCTCICICTCKVTLMMESSESSIICKMNWYFCNVMSSIFFRSTPMIPVNFIFWPDTYGEHHPAHCDVAQNLPCKSFRDNNLKKSKCPPPPLLGEKKKSYGQNMGNHILH